jgi:NADH-quinone oxidoreductase subunit E
MSVRRLDAVQPDSFSFTPENQAWAEATIGNYPDGKSAAAVIPVLWRAQEQNGGWISRPAMEHVAKLLDMSYIRVYEIATFYTMFQLSPVGRKAHVQVCGTTPCMLRGSDAIIDVCRRRIGPEPFHVSADGDFSWEEVECLGACVNAPMVLIGKDTYEDLTAESFEKVLSDIAAGRVPKTGPQNGRQLSAPEGPLTTLTDPSLYEARPRAEAKPPPPSTPAPAKPAPPAAAAPAPSPPVVPPPAAPPTAPERVKAAEAQAVTKAPPAPASAEPAKFAAGEDKRNVRGAKKAGSPAPAAETAAKTAARSQQAAKATSPANRGTPRKRPRKDEP